MVVNYTVVQTNDRLTTAQLNVHGAGNLDLLSVIEDDIGFHYIFYDSGSPVTYLSVYDYEGLSESDLQDDYGDNDWQLITTVREDVGIHYIFKDVS